MSVIQAYVKSDRRSVASRSISLDGYLVGLQFKIILWTVFLFHYGITNLTCSV